MDCDHKKTMQLGLQRYGRHGGNDKRRFEPPRVYRRLDYVSPASFNITSDPV